jgi:glycosyltransferase involved in cell wall biosynthesis
VVPQRDAGALEAALRRVLSEPGLADDLAEQAERKAPDLLWAAVAGRYRATAAAVVAESRAKAS